MSYSRLKASVFLLTCVVGTVCIVLCRNWPI